MALKTALANGVTKQDAKYLAAIDGCLNEMATIRNQMKKLDTEIRRTRASSRRKLDEVRAILRRVEATL